MSINEGIIFVDLVWWREILNTVQENKFIDLYKVRKINLEYSKTAIREHLRLRDISD